MVLGEAIVIDYNVIVLATPDGDVFLERNHHFLSVFENESEFCHGGVCTESAAAMSMMCVESIRHLMMH